MFKKPYILILMTSMLAVSACSTVHQGVTNLTGPAKSNAYLSSVADRAMVVFYREKGNTDSVPTVFVDEHVVGSLLPKRYAYTQVCPGEVRLRVDSRLQMVSQGSTKRINVDEKSITYVQVTEKPDNTFSMQVIAANDVPKDLGVVDQMSHVINRHAPICQKPVVIPPPAVPAPVSPKKVLRQITLGADALFVFDRTELLPKGRAEIDKLIRDIRQYGVQLTGLNVIGHTDRLGSDAYNDKLSLARAMAVANYMYANGLSSGIEIETSGRGKRDPVTTSCVGNRATPKLINCLQPDRRVTIQLMGLAE